MFNALKEQDGPIARELAERLKFRISQRRNKDVVSLMKYLTNKDLSSTDELPTQSKRTCCNFAIDLFLKLFKNNVDGMGNLNNINDISISSFAVSSDGAGPASAIANPILYKDYLADQLRQSIDKEQAPIDVSTASCADSDWSIEMKKTLKLELAAYDKTNVLGMNLQKLLSVLNSIQPTSTESERVFSLSSHFCTKIRSRLSDKSLNNLCFLKSYFIRKMNNA